MKRIRFWADCRPHEAMGLAATTFGEFEVFFGVIEDGEEVWRPNKDSSSLREVREWLEQNNKEIYEFIETQRPDRRGRRQYTGYIRNIKEPVEKEIALAGKDKTILGRLRELKARFGAVVTYHERPTRVNGYQCRAIVNLEGKNYAKAKAWLAQPSPEQPLWMKEGFSSPHEAFMSMNSQYRELFLVEMICYVGCHFFH